MARHNRRGRNGRSGRWDEAEEWEPRRRQDNRRRDRNRSPRPAAPAPDPEPPAPIALLPQATAEAMTCGRCQEWLADEVGGRGECLHPGSGILKPWWDTPACAFFH